MTPDFRDKVKKLLLTIPYIILGAICGIIMSLTELWECGDPFLFWYEKDQ